MTRARSTFGIAVALACAVGCAIACGTSSDAGSSPPSVTPLTSAELLDPKACVSCHPTEASRWSTSMHAFASDDPVFVAMNARAQRETGGAIGSFCVSCHAPVAVRTGVTTDGANLATLAAPYRGVTCYACHTIDAVTGTHDAAYTTKDDGVFRGPFGDPLPGAPHGSTASALHDVTTLGSSSMCGSCHDVRTPAGVDVETTYASWTASLYSHAGTSGLSCGGCHMPGSDGVAAAVVGAKTRRIHDHGMAAVDVVLDGDPIATAQAEGARSAFDSAVAPKLCVSPPSAGPTVTVTLDDAGGGHALPTGAAHDRRMWLELTATAAGAPIFSSGVTPAGTDPSDVDGGWVLRETLTDDAGAPVNMMWKAASSTVAALPPAVTADPTSPAFYHALSRTFDVPADADAITAVVKVTPFGADVLADLVASGDLDPAVAARVPIYTVATVSWAKAEGYGCF